jgi:hypothetical protein
MVNKKSAAALSWEGWGAAAVLFLGFPDGVSPDLFSFLVLCDAQGGKRRVLSL